MNRHFTITWNGLQVGWPLPVVRSPWNVSILDECTRHPLINHRVLWFMYKDIMCRWPEMQQYSVTRAHLVFIMLVLQWTFPKTQSADTQWRTVKLHYGTLFVNHNFWEYVRGDNKSKCCILRNRLSKALSERVTTSNGTVLGFKCVYAMTVFL